MKFTFTLFLVLTFSFCIYGQPATPTPIPSTFSVVGGTTTPTTFDYKTASIALAGPTSGVPIPNTSMGRIYYGYNSFFLTNNADFDGSNAVSNRDDISFPASMVEIGAEGVSIWSRRAGPNPINPGGVDWKSLGDAYFRLTPSNIQLMSANVGIGTDTPSQQLEVRGTARISVARGTDAVQFWDVTGGALRYSLKEPANSAGALCLYNNTSTPACVITLTSDGKVGIGTTTPTAPLQVVGVPEYADNAAALIGGLTVGAIYRTGDLLKVVH